MAQGPRGPPPDPLLAPWLIWFKNNLRDFLAFFRAPENRSLDASFFSSDSDSDELFRKTVKHANIDKITLVQCSNMKYINE